MTSTNQFDSDRYTHESGDYDFTLAVSDLVSQWKLIQAWRMGGHLSEEDALEAILALYDEAGPIICSGAMREISYFGYRKFYKRPCTARTRREFRTY